MTHVLASILVPVVVTLVVVAIAVPLFDLFFGGRK